MEMSSSDQTSFWQQVDWNHSQSGLQRSKRSARFYGLNTAYVERTNLTSRQMNGRMVRKTLSFSKEEEMLRASCALEDVVYNLARPLKSLRVEVNNDQRRWEPRSPAMAAGITDHIWTIGEIMMMLAVPERNNA